MKIKIQGFRCHVDSEYKFKDGQLILIKGPSGSGKSTILKAIEWCLYGKGTKVYNSSGVINKCAVTLDMGSYIIYRQKGPGLFKVIINNKTYEDEIAEQIVIKTLGDEKLWKACSFIEQKNRCALLTGSNLDQKDLLNKLAFNNSDPGVHIDRIASELKTIDAKHTELECIYNRDCEQFNKDAAIKPIECDLSPDDIQLYQQQLPQLKEQLILLEKSRLEQRELKGKYHTMTENLNTIKKNIDQIPIHTEDEIKELRNQLSNLETIIKEKERYDDIINKLNHYQKKYLEITDQLSKLDKDWKNYQSQKFTKEDCWSIQNQEKLYLTNLTKCQQLGCSYTKEAIQTEINNIHHQLHLESQLEQRYKNLKFLDEDYQNLNNETLRQISISKKITKLEESLKSNQSELDKLNTTQLPNLDELLLLRDQKQQECNLARTVLHEIKQSESILSCPHCSGSLIYNNGALFTSDKSPITSDQKIKAHNNCLQLTAEFKLLTDHYNQVKADHNKLVTDINTHKNDINSLENSIKTSTQELIESEEKIKHFNNRITSLEHSLGGADEIKNLRLRLSNNINQLNSLQVRLVQLTSLQVINNPPLSSTFISLLIDLDNLTSEKTKLESEIGPLSTLSSVASVSDLRQQITQLTSRYHQYSKEYHTRDTLLTQQINLELALSTIILNPQIETDYLNTLNYIQYLEVELVKAEYVSSMRERHKQIQQQLQQLDNLNLELVALRKLHQNAIMVESKMLQSTVDYINNAMADIFPLMFDEPITVLLKLDKELKSGKRTVHKVNLLIHYKGADYDNVNQLSGGEGDRVSLGLILALNRVSSSPFLMLDECLTSLDPSIRESCLKALRENISGLKTILCVNHDDVEGYYDDVLRLDK